MVTLICDLGSKFKFLGVDDYGVELLLVLLKSIINCTYLSSPEDCCKQTTALMLLQRFGALRLSLGR